MASTDAIPVPRKNAAYRFYFAIRKPSDSTLITTWSGMDSEVSLDGASFSDCTNEATEIGTSGCGYIDLTSSEMNADSVVLKVTVTNTGAVPLVFTFLPESAGDYRCDVQLWNSVSLGTTNPLPNAAPAAIGGLLTAPTTGNTGLADVTRLLGTAWLTPGTAGTPDVNLTTTALGSIWNRLTSALTVSGSIGKRIVDYLTGDAYTLIGATGSGLTSLASAAQVSGLAINTRANLQIPVEIETPDTGTQVFKIKLHLFDVEGNMEAPDSTPTIALVNAAGTDRSSRLSAATVVSTGAYSWDYTATAADAEEQLNWMFTVVEGGLTRLYPATSYVVEESAYRFSSTDRATLNAAASQTSVDDLPTNSELTTALGTGSWATSLAQSSVWTSTLAASLAPIRSGTAQAGDSTTITLDASASSVNDFYVPCGIYLTGGTGAGQFKTIDEYNGTTKVATISEPWYVTPDNTTTFSIRPEGVAHVDLRQLGGNELSAGYLKAIADYYGINTKIPAQVEGINADVISADAVSAAAGAKLADISRRRTQASVEASSDGDALSIGSLYGLIQQAQESNASDAAGYLTIYKTDGTTSLGTKVLSTNASADPVDGIS